MSTSTARQTGLDTGLAADRAAVAHRYGHFSPDGKEFHVTSVKTPRPWVNIIANPQIGLAVSQTGSGFTWIDDSQLAVVTRWQQDLVGDRSGKFLYVRDSQSGEFWSLSPAPTWPAYDHYVCRHGLGYTVFVTEYSGIRAEWTTYVLKDGDPKPRVMMLETQTSEGSLDPVDLFSDPADIFEYRRADDTIITEIVSGPSSFSASR